MQNLALIDNEFLVRLVEKECKHLDFIYSWEELVSVYKHLSFVDDLTDEARLTEFKYVIKHMNSFLTKMRKGLEKANDTNTALEFLYRHWQTAPSDSINSRKEVAYQKYRQSWVDRMIREILAHQDTLRRLLEESEREDDDV